MTAEREMRIMRTVEFDRKIKESGRRVVLVHGIPWGMFDQASERQAQHNHGQTLNGLSSRGGLDATEAIAILACSRWYTMDDEYAHRILYVMRALYRRQPEAAP